MWFGGGDKYGFAFVVAVLMGGFFIALSMEALDRAAAAGVSEEIKNRYKTVAIVLALAPLILTPVLSNKLASSIMTKIVMKRLGMYSERAALWVSPDNLNELTEAADLLQTPLSVCKHKDGSAIVSDLEVVWHGIGG